jgi:hypothetical protein
MPMSWDDFVANPWQRTTAKPFYTCRRCDANVNDDDWDRSEHVRWHAGRWRRLRCEWFGCDWQLGEGRRCLRCGRGQFMG